MISFKNINFTYENAVVNGNIRNINLEIPKGQVVLLCGESGCGKTTLTRLINGLIPHFYDGELTGTVTIEGKEVAQSELYELASVVGSVFQNPKSQFYTVQTDTEIVFGSENIGMERSCIERNFLASVTAFNLQALLGRSLFDLSGGEKQRIACASVATLNPDIFVLDEPTSNLDIRTIKELKRILTQWKKAGKTIVIAEHRLEWLKEIVDRLIYMKDGEISQDFSRDEWLQMQPAQLKKMGLRAAEPIEEKHLETEIENKNIIFNDFKFSYDQKKVLDIQKLMIPEEGIIAVIGNNGAGKTTFSRLLCGLEKKAKGTMKYKGKTYTNKERVKQCYMVMQDVNHQLFTESVLDEILLSMEKQKLPNKQEKALEILNRLHLEAYKSIHPMALSGGQKQRVAIGSALASNKDLLIYDEPTSGLDYRHMKEVAANIKLMKKSKKTQFIVTHDLELILECCDYVIYFEKGKIKWQGRVEENLDRLNQYFLV